VHDRIEMLRRKASLTLVKTYCSTLNEASSSKSLVSHTT
jgi:hypothetical protein